MISLRKKEKYEMKKTNILMIIAFLMLLLIVPVVAQEVVDPGGDMNIEDVILYLTPFIVFGVGQLVKWVKPKITGTWLLILLGSSSGILAFLTSLADTPPDVAWYFKLGYGLLAVVGHQFYKQIKSGN